MVTWTLAVLAALCHRMGCCTLPVPFLCGRTGDTIRTVSRQETSPRERHISIPVRAFHPPSAWNTKLSITPGPEIDLFLKEVKNIGEKKISNVTQAFLSLLCSAPHPWFGSGPVPKASGDAVILTATCEPQTRPWGGDVVGPQWHHRGWDTPQVQEADFTP